MLNNRQLLQEVMDFHASPQMIKESLQKNNGRLIIQGPLQKADTLNENRRRYPKAILMREAERYTREYINQRRATGELDHPEDSIVNLKNVSHNILGLWWEGNTLMGKIEVLPTPMGNILRNLLEAGIRVGISSRGLGSVTEIDGIDEVADDYEIICWDMVSTPSTPGAWMNVINENKQNQVKEILNSRLNKLIIEVLSELK